MLYQRVLPSWLFLAGALAGCAEDRVAGPRRELPTWLPAATLSTAVNGKLAFVSTRDGNAELYTMDPDGSNQTRLTNHAAMDVYPAWAPDGTHLAFTSNRDGPLEIYVMNASCPNRAPARLTNNSVMDVDPAWSADGSKIAFMSERDGPFRQIYVMNSDGSNPTNVSNGVGVYSDEEPHWSPDGTKIAFARSGDVFVMNANGSGKTNLTNQAGNDVPMAWSPNGATILFVSSRDEVSYELYVMNASDGSGVVRLTYNLLAEYPAIWSPDGTKIAFNLSGRVYTMDANGANQVPVTNTGFDTSPDWAPQPGSAPNDIDCDFINDIVDLAPGTPSTGFSDVSLGGATAGTVVSVPANVEVAIDDVVSPGGIAVTVTAIGPVPNGARVHLSIAGKQGQVKLAIPGTYVITDPVTSTTVAVQADGPAEVELTLNGRPVVISIADGASATVNEITDGSGVLTDVTVSNVTGNPGDVTANGTTVAPGGPPYSIPTAILSATLSLKSGKLTMTGSLNPAGATGIDPGTQTVTLNAGAYSFVKTGGLRRNPGGVYTVEGTLASAPGVQLKLNVKAPKPGSASWTFEATASPVSGFVNPVTVSLQIGNVKGSAQVTASLR